MAVTRAVAAVSCDEAFLDVTGLGDPVEVARKLRADIRAATGCAASCGVGPSMLLARLATKRAKPDGLVAISPAQVFVIVHLGVVCIPGLGLRPCCCLASSSHPQCSCLPCCFVPCVHTPLPVFWLGCPLRFS